MMPQRGLLQNPAVLLLGKKSKQCQRYLRDSGQQQAGKGALFHLRCCAMPLCSLLIHALPSRSSVRQAQPMRRKRKFSGCPPSSKGRSGFHFSAYGQDRLVYYLRPYSLRSTGQCCVFAAACTGLHPQLWHARAGCLCSCFGNPVYTSWLPQGEPLSRALFAHALVSGLEQDRPISWGRAIRAWRRQQITSRPFLCARHVQQSVANLACINVNNQRTSHVLPGCKIALGNVSGASPAFRGAHRVRPFCDACFRLVGDLSRRL